MNVCIAAKVVSQDGMDIGKIKGIVFDPRLREVTHLVVHKGVFFPHDTLIPMNMVQGNTDGTLILHEVSGDVGELPKYDEGLFRKGPAGTQEVAASPAGEHFGVKELPDRAQQLRKAIHIEPGSVEIKAETDVEALDGKLGSVACFRVDQYTNHLTYVVVYRGRQRKKEINIPVEWVDKVDGERIALSVPMQMAIEGPPPPAGPYIPVEPREEELHP